MEDNENKDSLPEGEENNSGNKENNNAPQDESYNQAPYGGYNGGYWQSQGYGQYGGYSPYPSGPVQQNKSKFLIILISVIAVLLVAAIVGIGILYNQVIRPMLGEVNPEEKPFVSTAAEIIDGAFDLTQPETPGASKASLTEAYNATYKSVVEINVASETQGTAGSGSGFIVGKKTGENIYYIVTNNHVVEGATSINVTLFDGKEYTAVGSVLRDEVTDIAVIAINPTEDLTSVIAKLGKSANLSIGESVYAIGSPLGLTTSLTDGIISKKDTQLYVDPHVMTYIQTTTPINPGNSGGPLFNMAGEVVAIANLKIAGESVDNVAFAIPIDSVITVIEDMVKTGRVTDRHDLGIATTHNLYGTGGLWVSSITTDSSFKAALTANSVPQGKLYGYRILSIVNKTKSSGGRIDASSMANQFIDTFKPNDEIEIVIAVHRLDDSTIIPIEGYEQVTISLKLGPKDAAK